MLAAITVLLLFQLIGEVVSQGFALPIPGPVVGMALFFAALAVPQVRFPALRRTTQQLLRHLSLLFVPAGVGVMLHTRRVAEEWLPIAAALVLSTVLAVIVAALTTRWLARRLETRRRDR